MEPEAIPGSLEDSQEGTGGYKCWSAWLTCHNVYPGWNFIPLLGGDAPQLSKQEAVEEGIGDWGPYLEGVEKVPALSLLTATCHSWPVLIEINGLLSRSLGRLFRKWILMGRVQGPAKSQA